MKHFWRDLRAVGTPLWLTLVIILLGLAWFARNVLSVADNLGQLFAWLR